MRFATGLLTALLLSGTAFAHNWPCWRGAQEDGTSLETNMPVHWSASENIRWKTELPGNGHASPIVWGDKIFTVTAVLESNERRLLCLNRKTGAIVWQKTVVTTPAEGKHGLNSYASSTPATDGGLIYVTFLDRQEMVAAAYDFDGNQQWLVRPGAFSSMHGFCSSPLLFKDKVIVNGDHDGDSYIVALNRTDGKTLWKIPREHHTRSYCAPIIREIGGKTQMVLSGDKSVASYDPNTGARHWIMDGPTEQFVASPVYNPGADLLFVTGGFPQFHIIAIDPHGTGNVTSTHIKWRTTRGASYVPSPISVGDYFFIVSDGGIASCFEAKSGKQMWNERLKGDHHASLVSANGLVYFLSDKGIMTVVEAKPEFKIVAENPIGETCFASPALSNGEIFLRGDHSLFCISNQK
ncbi:MAG: outer rane biosis protein BamB [Verrucomicrobiales bacterium]|jgi:outer membrane protein assembly factor BamB|nr:outer rane biosis protein BamB [Verrucomicrobiales bacterium]